MRFPRPPIAIALLACALALVACAKPKAPEEQLVGQWTGEIKNTPPSGDPKIDAMMKNMQAMMKASLELRQDKTFTMSMGMPMTGTWSLAGSEVTLKTEKIGDMTMAEAQKSMSEAFGKMGQQPVDLGLGKPMRFTTSADFQSLTSIAEPGERNAGQLVFTETPPA